MRLLHREDGWAVATAMMVMALILSFGLALFVYVDGQQAIDQQERQRDSSFDIAEGVLSAQTFLVGRQWPTATDPAPLSGCSSASTPSGVCPSPAWVTASLGGADYAAAAAWNSQVFDNALPDQSYYKEGVTNTSGVAHYDANGDGRIWIRAQGQVKGITRTLVAQVRLQRTGDEAINIPHNLVTAGKLATGNNGNKVILNTQGSAASPGTIDVRCTVRTSACLDYRSGQVSPDTTTLGYPGMHAVTLDMVNRMRDRAKAEGTYFTNTCPDRPDAGVPGSLVFIENADCHFTGNGTANTETNPGILFAYSGTLRFTGSWYFYGLVYAYNATNLTAMNVVDTGGNTTIQGAVIVDGDGGVTVGSSGNNPANLIWDDRYLYQQSTVYTYGSAGVIQSTWRQVQAAWSG
jgi:hypothetical protein